MGLKKQEAKPLLTVVFSEFTSEGGFPLETDRKASKDRTRIAQQKEKGRPGEAERFPKKNVLGEEQGALLSRPGQAPQPCGLQALCVRPPAASSPGFWPPPPPPPLSVLHGGRDLCLSDLVSLATAPDLDNVCSRETPSQSLWGHLSARSMLLGKYLLSVGFA